MIEYSIPERTSVLRNLTEIEKFIQVAYIEHRRSLQNYFQPQFVQQKINLTVTSQSNSEFIRRGINEDNRSYYTQKIGTEKQGSSKKKDDGTNKAEV